KGEANEWSVASGQWPVQKSLRLLWSLATGHYQDWACSALCMPSAMCYIPLAQFSSPNPRNISLMRILDPILQKRRARMARPWIPAGAAVLDIGCHQGEFLSSLGDRIGPSIGLDPLTMPQVTPRFRLVAQPFAEPSPFADQTFDAVVMLATLEHITDKTPLARECSRLLRPGGRVIITVPSRQV